jgi:hypothetical protein
MLPLASFTSSPIEVPESAMPSCIAVPPCTRGTPPTVTLPLASALAPISSASVFTSASR